MTAHGILRHHFHGSYACTIGLQFADEASATDASRALAGAWHRGSSPHVLLATLDSDGLAEFVAKYLPTPKACGRKSCRHQCRDAPIDNVNHSVDYGGQFTVEIPTTPVEQGALFA